MAANIGAIAQLLDATLDPGQHRKAETALKAEQAKPQYSLNLLNIVASDPLPAKTRLSAALAFKNFIRNNYVDEEGNYKLPQDEVVTIKQQLIGLMISSPPAIQSQLGEAVAIIADSDFWQRWETLTKDLVSRFSTTDPKVNIGVLEVAHSIFVRWRPLFRTDDLYTEINHVITTMGEPFIQLLITTNTQIEANSGNKEALKAWFETLSLLVKIFYDLSCHDNPLLETDDDAEASIVDTVKADICEALELYTVKFDEDFSKYCGPFITNVWELLSSMGPETKYDHVVSKALHFLTAVASTKDHSGNFNNEDTLSQIVEKVILPNVALRESDIELFEDEPIEFIRRDLEGSDTDSRRRSATDFYGNSRRNSRGKSDWKAKDTAIYLFISIAAKGAVTAAQGVKTINSLVNVVEFFQQHIAADLMSDSAEPIAKVDAIKYLHTFRSQLSKDQWRDAFPHLIKNIGSSNYVIYTYAAIAVERLLFLADDNGVQMFTRADVEGFANELLERLFVLIEREPTPAKLQENEFLMRCVMRILIVIKDGAAAILDGVLQHLIAITNIMKQNPSNPRFYYYHFEAIGALVRYCSGSKADVLNAKLWEPIQLIFTEDVTEFMQYVLQILAQLLESSPDSSISANFGALLDPILNPPMWEVRGNVPALARLLAGLIPRASKEIIGGDKMNQLYAFDILEATVKAYEGNVLDNYFATILELLFKKLQNNPAESFKLRFVRLFHLVSARLEAGYGTDYFIKHANKLQDNLFKQLYPAIILMESDKLARPVDRKLAVVSYTKTLCESRAFADEFKKGWANTCNKLIML
ncbi:unnamed protein product [Parascedosporium putredinis]|uniref:Importin N-terminal domain-containing protein n=1 Tax=Parascedosporium putredinis TaxID=1442378 RepID=A0A9P1GUK2_9PEZI|nr:unnamed protein product [Parascedosporium putredinis]CAI7987383.1 unnamed protein product [Parascedosporium putredinis]